MTVTEPVRIAILDDYQHVALRMADWTAIRSRAEIIVFDDTIADPVRLVERLVSFDVLCVMRERTPLPADILARLPRLKLVISTGPKNGSIDDEAAEARGVEILNTAGTLVPPMELTWALILAAARHIFTETVSLRAGGWQRSIGDGLEGKVLGILGLGTIGTEVARIGHAFGMKTIAWDPRLTKNKAAEAGVDAVSKETMFAQSDFLSIHLVLVGATRGLVGAAELGLMKPTAWLINTSRGPITDEAALILALRERRIAGAALDVFETEPLPADHPFRSLDNVLATPHLGYVERGQYEIYFREMVAHLTTWLDRQNFSADA